MRIVEKMNEEISEVCYQYVRELFFTDREEIFREIASLAGYRQRFLYYYCRLACETYEKYQRAGIGDRVFFDTFSDIAVWCQVCFRRYGEYGIQEYEWLWRHVEMALFRLGRLQFEKTESLWEFEYKGRKTAVGDPVISIHIPEGQPLDPEACRESLDMGRKFWLEESGDVDKILGECKYTVDRTYHTKANQQAMMETFRTYCYMDYFGRLNVVSSTQIPFHVRRILGNALDIPSSKVRVIKPRIGGGFGAKQTSVCEIYPAFVTWMTGRPSKIIYSRYESQICASPRHEMEIRVRTGADENGIVRAIDVYTLSNAGAYGEHSPTTVGLSGHKSIALYRHTEAYRFAYDVVYTNVQAAGAYRGYGATQGIYAVESAVNELAEIMGMDPVKIRELNMPLQGEPLPAYGDCDTAESCTMDQCMERAKEMMNWDEKYPCKDLGNGKVRGVGVAMAMQGSSIAGIDVGGADMKLNEDGSYTLGLGCADMGTGCDTILAQMAADCMETSIDNIVVFGVDTDISPYDSGSYASATTYTTGMAVVQSCQELRGKICALGAKILQADPEEVNFDGEFVFTDEEHKVSLKDIAIQGTCGNSQELQVTRTYSSPVSPPPFMVGMAEVEVDKETGSTKVIDYVAVVDCGTPINPNLVRVQTEGGIAQGIGMALYEDIQYNEKGAVRNNSFMQYKIPSRLDIGDIRVEIRGSYEPTGPFGAKSVGELVIDTPCPAIAAAVYNATGVRVRELPITPEKVAMGILQKESEK